MRSIFQHAKNRNVIAIQRDVLVLIAIKSTAMLLLLQIDPYPSILEWISGYTRKEAYAKALGVSFISILCIAAIAACGFMRNAWLRVIIVCTIASLYWMNLTYHRIVGEPIDYLAASILLGETREIGRALSMYHREALAVLAIVIPPAVALAYLPRRCPLKLPAWTASLSLLAMALVFAVLCVTGGVSRFPTPFTLPGHLGLVALLRPYSGPREPVTYSGEIAPMVRHVVFIVDESVRGDLLA
ncbi:MAG: hypothetical protein ACREX3_23690, partial [Gammaproteobacteria bacterium]